MKLKPYTPGDLLLPADRPPMVREDPEMRRVYDLAKETIDGFERMSTFERHKVLMRLKKEGKCPR